MTREIRMFLVTTKLQEQKDYRVDPDYFNQNLRTDGAVNGFMVDAIIVTPALPNPFTQITYDQRAD